MKRAYFKIGTLAILVVLRCSSSAVARRPKASLCSISEVQLTVAMLNHGQSPILVEDATTVKELEPVIESIEKATWMKVVPARPGLAGLKLGYVVSGSFARGGTGWEEVGHRIVYALMLDAPSVGVHWEGTVEQFEGVKAYAADGWSQARELSGDNAAGWRELFTKLAKAAHGCQ